MCRCDYAFFTGHGNQGNDIKWGNRKETGWVDAYFYNGASPSVRHGHDWSTEEPAKQVIMVDDANYRIVDGELVPRIFNGKIQVNHLSSDQSSAAGQNMVYLDGHVEWLSDPWVNGVRRWCRNLCW